MKKNLAKKITLSILAGAVLMSSSVVWAENITNFAPPDSGWVGIDMDSDPNDFELYAPGTNSAPSASNNKVVFNDSFIGTVNVDFAGGFSDSGDVEKNTVTISGGTFAGVIGGLARNGANSNTVIISDGTIMGDVSGGFAVFGDATGNTVTISGGVFNSFVYGGSTLYGNANYNTVNISGGADLTKASLFGGFVHSNQPYATYGGANSPNTLNIGWDGEKTATWTGANTGKLEVIAGFDVINFAYVDWVKEGTVVEVTKGLLLDNTKITVGTVNVANGGITANDKMHLLELTSENDSIVGDLDEDNSSNKVKVNINEGVAKTYNDVDCAISKTANTIDLVIKEALSVVPDEGQDGGTPEPERNDQVLVLGESRAAAVAFTNQGSELIELGLNALARDNSKDTKVFAAVYGNHSEYETGSHVNVNGWSGIVGVGKTNANGLTVGAFFENGEGNYSTHNIFTADYIRGDGEANYNGGGLLVRKDNANGVYAEASLRAGNLQNELRNAVRNGQDLTGYDVDTFYYGAHIGIGKVIPRGADGDSLDVYGKFIYTHHDGETFDVGGTPTKFDSVESERLRLGFRLNEVQTNKLSMYYGAAWEYEFNGDAHDKIASFDLEPPSLEGSTVIGEVGAHYKASEKWSLDLNARAYTGQREGFSGSVQANYSF